MIEETIRFGRSQHLIGTITRPVGEPAGGMPRVAVLLTNAGFISRIGPRRINVKIAHRLAALGIASFRWDLSGLGDSDRPVEDAAAGEQFVRDTGDAMQQASTCLGVSDFIMVGFCSGAQVAFRTALRDQRLRGLVLFDHFKFKTYKSNLRWLRRRFGAVGPVGIMPALMAGVMRRSAGLLERLRRRRERAMQNAELADPSLHEYATLVQTLLTRGVRMYFMYSGGFPRIFNYADQFNDLYARFGIPAAVDWTYLPSTDHLITPAREQAHLIDLVVSWVETTACELQADAGEQPAGERGSRQEPAVSTT